MKALGGPHLVLAHVGEDHAVFRKTAEEFIEEADGWLCQSTRIEFGALGTASDGTPFFEVRD